MSGLDANRKIAVILVADVVGYSKHMEKDENATLQAYSECEKILKGLLEKRQGLIFNTAGDSVLAEFNSAVNAVECAVEFQNKMIELRKSDGILAKLEFRIGINMGDVVSREGNLLGDGVNIAARLEALSQPNGVCISKSIYDLVVPKTKMTFNDLGVQKVKQNSFHAYDVLLDPSQKRSLKSFSPGRVGVLIGLAAACAVLFGIFSMVRLTPSETLIERTVSSRPLVLVAEVKPSGLNQSQVKLMNGLTESVISYLSKSEALRVVPTKTATKIGISNFDDATLNEEYGVRFVVYSSIQGSENTGRLNLEITDTKSGEVVLTSKKNLKLAELFEFQDSVGKTILNEFNFNILNQKGLMRSYFSTRKLPITEDQLVDYLNWRREFTKWTVEGYVTALSMLKEFKNWPNTQQDEWFEQEAWLNFQGILLGQLPNTEENLIKIANDLEKTIADRPSAETYGSKGLMGLLVLNFSCDQAIENIAMANALGGSTDSFTYASIVHGRCGNQKEAIDFARNAYNLVPVDVNWSLTNMLATRLYEDGQISEMYRLLDDAVDAKDLPAPLLGLIAYDKYISDETEDAQNYLIRAKSSGFDKAWFAIDLYDKELSKDAIEKIAQLEETIK